MWPGLSAVGHKRPGASTASAPMAATVEQGTSTQPIRVRSAVYSWVPSNLSFRHQHRFADLSWRSVPRAAPSYGGPAAAVRNAERLQVAEDRPPGLHPERLDRGVTQLAHAGKHLIAELFQRRFGHRDRRRE